ncbi:MAG: radical SAM protein, partial [Desulfobacterales bacterium]
KGYAGAHFVVGMGETEKEMCEAIQKTRDMSGRTHLFSYFPEEGSAMNNHQPPPMDQYRRIQLARYLIDEALSRSDRFTYNEAHQIDNYNLPESDLNSIIDGGEPFRTSGCSGYDGVVACNRPYGNSRPGPDIRNFPFAPLISDISHIRKQMHLEKRN